MEHSFTATIRSILEKSYGIRSEEIFQNSLLIQYINEKTRSANKGSKSRSSFANLYAIYVLVEDYLKKGLDKKGRYLKYEGAIFSDLFERQRALPFGDKLQNHALNHRMNSEFKKFFPKCGFEPIVRQTNRYWINEKFLKIKINGTQYNISQEILEIINKYIEVKKASFSEFINNLKQMQEINTNDDRNAPKLIISLLSPKVDARIFEIVSYSILKYHFHDQKIFWGFDIKKLNEENLKLYKTGRTNANDGGIDFVMKPLGRFFQVTETLDFKKYFLDIDKIEKFPITFIIKSDEDVDVIKKKIEKNAYEMYPIERIVVSYMKCIEEIINVPMLKSFLVLSIEKGFLPNIIEEILIQSKVEFNFQDDDDSDDE
ncbi:MAG TPA: restriction endonuclease [bacterium]|nr:restriction endonuclease [bacterium]